MQLSSEYHIVLSNTDQLADKIRIFQSRCVELEAKVKTQEQELSDIIKQLKRENQLLKDKQDSATKAIKDLQQQIEDLLKKNKENAS